MLHRVQRVECRCLDQVVYGSFSSAVGHDFVADRSRLHGMPWMPVWHARWSEVHCRHRAPGEKAGENGLRAGNGGVAAVAHRQVG